MEYKIHCADAEHTLLQGVNELVAEHLGPLEKQVSKFSSRSLLVSLERHRSSQLLALKLSLSLDQQTLTVSAESPFLESVISLGFRKLLRQVRMHKEGLRRSKNYERVRSLKHSLPKNEEIEELALELENRARQRDFKGFKEQLTDLLPRLENFIRREIHFHETGKNLPNQAELARDIVEDTLLDTYEKFLERPEGFHPEKWMFRHAMELCQQHIAHAHDEVLESEWKDLPRKPEAASPDCEMESWIEELDRFPREVMDFDALAASAESDAQFEQLRRRHVIAESLDRLPKFERKALFLCFLEGFHPAEAAAVLNCSEKTVRALINEGTERLKDFLVENGSILRSSKLHSS